MQTALTVAQRRLPVEMTTPPSFRKVNPGDFPVLFISLNSQTLPLSTVDEYAGPDAGQQISQLPGVAQVLVYGAQKFAVRVQVDPEAAAARGLSLDDIRRPSPRPIPTRRSARWPARSRTSRCRRRPQLDKAARLHATSWSPGATARRSSSTRVARVIDSVENDKIASWFNGERSIVLAIQRQPDANTVEVVDAIKDRLPAFRAAGAGVDPARHADRPLDLDPPGGQSTCRRRC